MRIQTKELVISEKLKRKVEMICRFAYIQKNMNMMTEILLFFNTFYQKCSVI